MSLNKVQLIGNVGKDPDVRYLDSGVAVATFPLATTDRGYTLANGTQVPERTEWHNIVLWRGLPGDKLYIEGKIRSRSYDDQNGVKRYVVEIFGDNMEMLSSPRQSQQAPQSAPAQPSGAQPVQQGSAAQSAPAGEMSDDLPF